MKSRFGLAPNPLLSREIRARFRDGRAFGLLFVIVTGLSVFFALLYEQIVASNAPGARLSPRSGQTIFAQLAWMQTFGWLLISPALTTSSIAYERERGWFDSLLLSPLTPRAIVVGKWGAALLFTAILMLVTLPLLSLIFLLGGVTTRQFLLITLLHVACASCGAAIGIATSAWSMRTGAALRTAYGLIFTGFALSVFGAAMVGELPFSFGFAGTSTSLLWRFLGRTNPVFRALEVTDEAPSQHVLLCLGFLLATTLFFLAIATYYARRPLQEAPFIGRSSTPKTNAAPNATQPVTTESAATAQEATATAQSASNSSTAPQTSPRATHGEIPLVTKLRFANPVLDREVRSKFRMRQPPLLVIISEICLGLLVAFFYLRTLYWALFEPNYRDLIWFGLCITGLIVTMMAASLMGSNGLTRERENGTWEGVRLSLLSPGEIVRGKLGASLLTCALFSLPVWPLLLPCVVWSIDVAARSFITRFDALSALLVWAGTAWNYTLIGLWMGRRATRTSRASGQTLGVLTAFLLLAPFIIGYLDLGFTDAFLQLTHPFIALIDSKTRGWEIALHYALFQGGFGAGIWLALHRALKREMGGEI